MRAPQDLLERVYAGVLGKIVGVYLGRPVEGWTYERIAAEVGEVAYYLHKRRGVPLVVPDDDISGTFTFLRALPDHGSRRDLTPRQIGQTWLNYIVPGRSILWWGGMGMSTEHTAFLRLRRGVEAPASGSLAVNGSVVAEQIGAQIFIDGWAMVAAGDPELAADLARRAASVSHDGAAVHAAQVVAAMEAQAFVEANAQKLLDVALSLIPADSVIRRLIDDVREWHKEETDWRSAREKLADRYGYHRYPGNCHVVPNHGLIILALLYGEDDFQKSLMIVNTCGWDTDCNSGNLGCLLGIKNGLAGIDAGPDWRGPVADRLYLPAADGGRVITDAVRESYHIVNAGRALTGLDPLAPKDGARFHFEAPGAVQGFRVEASHGSTARLQNVPRHSRQGARALAIRYDAAAPGSAIRAATATFTPPEVRGATAYRLMATATLYTGQLVRAGIEADGDNAGPVSCRLYLLTYDGDDEELLHYGPQSQLGPGDYTELEWQVPETAGQPIAEIGVELQPQHGSAGAVYLDYLTWTGTPRVRLGQPPQGGTLWRQAWVDAMDHWRPKGTFQLAHDDGVGLLINGTTEWTDYRVAATLRPLMARSFGLAARVQGLQRYYALLLVEGCKVRLVRRFDHPQILAEQAFEWALGTAYRFELVVRGRSLKASIDGEAIFECQDPEPGLSAGGVAFVCEEGSVVSDGMDVEPSAG